MNFFWAIMLVLFAISALLPTGWAIFFGVLAGILLNAGLQEIYEKRGWNEPRKTNQSS